MRRIRDFIRWLGGLLGFWKRTTPGVQKQEGPSLDEWHLGRDGLPLRYISINQGSNRADRRRTMRMVNSFKRRQYRAWLRRQKRVQLALEMESRAEWRKANPV